MRLLIPCVLALTSSALHAQEAGVPIAGPGAIPPTTSATGATRDLALTWPGTVHPVVEAGDYEVVVRFDAPLGEEEIKRFSAAAGPLLADLRWNDDNLVMRPAPGNRIEAEAEGNAVHVRILAEAPALASGENGMTADDGQKELELARAQADAAAGYPGQARRRLSRLAARDPSDTQIRRALADAEAAEGALPFAAARYTALGADDLFARRIIGEADGRATANAILRHGKTFTQWEAGIDASIRVGSGVALGAGLRHVETAANDVASAGGYIPHVRRGFNVGTLSAAAWFSPEARLVVQVSSLFERPVTGAGARLFLGPPERQARLFASYRLPDFSTAEQSWRGGHLSRVGGGGTLRITPELIAQADVGWNGYGLAGGGTRTTSITATAGADYLILRGRRSLQLSYRLDAEYVRRQDRYPGGIPLIPLSDRENHTVQAIFSMPLRQVQVTAAAGWTKDRYGGDGPTASLGATANLGDAWRLDASGGVSSISRQAVSGTQIYLQLTLTRFLRS